MRCGRAARSLIRTGEFRFEDLRKGKYAIFPDDFSAGYSEEAASLTGSFSGAEITFENADAKVWLVLPAKGAFLRVNLTNRQTGDIIPDPIITFESHGGSPQTWFRIKLMRPGCNWMTPRCAVGIPADTPVVVHISADGFREWDESANGGKLLLLKSGAYEKLDIQLDPLGN